MYVAATEEVAQQKAIGVVAFESLFVFKWRIDWGSILVNIDSDLKRLGPRTTFDYISEKYALRIQSGFTVLMIVRNFAR